MDTNQQRTDEGAEPPEISEEERRAARVLRYRLMEALEEDGWTLEINGDTVQLGSSSVILLVRTPDHFHLYKPIGDPAFDDVGDIAEANAYMPVGAFLAKYESVGGDPTWGAFQRLPAPPEEIGPGPLGTWLSSIVDDVSLLAAVYDAEPNDPREPPGSRPGM